MKQNHLSTGFQNRRHEGFFLLLLVSLFMMIPGKKIVASHMAGADLTYEYTGTNQYRVTYTLYRDCSGVPAPAGVTLTLQSARCAVNRTFQLSRVQGSGEEITHTCPNSATICSGGTNPGIQRWQYSGPVTVQSPCSDWVMSVVNCCRNPVINTLNNPDNSGMYVEARLNNVNGPNSSPVFSNKPVLFACNDQDFIFNHGVIEPDGDSLSYHLIPPMTNPNSYVSFSQPYSAQNPISSSPSVSMDPENGDIIMHPTMTQTGVMAIQVNEFRNGIQIGSVMRDLQICVQNCSNHLPALSGIDGDTSRTVSVCPGTPLCFDIFSADSDPDQQLSLSWNQAIPGASFTVSQGTRPSGHFCWTPSLSDARLQPYIFTVTIRDNNCPVNGMQTVAYSVNVSSLHIDISSTPVSCGGRGDGSASVTVSGGTAPYNYFWSPDGGTEAIAPGLHGGLYNVFITDEMGCSATASVMVDESQPLQLNVSSEPATCHASDGSLLAGCSGGTMPYSYFWSPGGMTDAEVSGLTAGIYHITVSDANGCTAQAMFPVNGGGPQLSIDHRHDATCENGDDGFASIQAFGEAGPFTYSWYPFGGTQAVAPSLSPGNYIAGAEDYNGCPSFISFSIGFEHEQPHVNLGADIIACNGSPVILDPGSSYNAYLWSDQTTNPQLQVNLPGTYSVLVTDGYGCQNLDAINVNYISCQPDGPAFHYRGANASVFPNPVRDYTTVSIDNSDLEVVSIHLMNLMGEIIWTSNTPGEKMVRREIDMRNLSPGIYILDISGTGGHSGIRMVKE